MSATLPADEAERLMTLGSYPALDMADETDLDAVEEAKAADFERAEYCDARDAERTDDAEEALLAWEIKRTASTHAQGSDGEKQEKHTADEVKEEYELAAAFDALVADRYAASPTEWALLLICELQSEPRVSQESRSREMEETRTA